MLHDLILGTAGHIDHGKTSLIAALTGTNTDRLPEEKKRGITIEPGYACLDLPPFRLGIVDVPGHEKFIRQMLAGASGIDIALLVVAANDSVKQQTREHLDILRFLDLPTGVIALTKSDLVEPDWLELVVEEVKGLVGETFLASAPIVPVSSKTGQGLDSLKSALQSAAEIASVSSRRLRVNAPFRMSIDRAFTIDGHGTVVTGSVGSGTARAGEILEIQPGGQPVRVRSVENHDQVAESVQRGQRAAINLSGIQLDDVRRGLELSVPGFLIESQLMTVELLLLKSASQPLKDGKRVRFHIGTAEILATIRLLDRQELLPGDQGFAQIYFNEPAVAVWSQPFVIRRESPVTTIGGGRVLDPSAEKIRRATTLDLQMLSELTSTNEVSRGNASAYFHTDSGWSQADLPRSAGVFAVNDVMNQLLSLNFVFERKLSTTRTWLIQSDRFKQFCERVTETLQRMHRDFPLRFKHSKSDLEAKFAYLESKELLIAAIQHLESTGKIELDATSIGLTGEGPKLSKGERVLLGQLAQQVRAGGLKPPTPDELMHAANKNKDSVKELLRLAVESGDLVAVSNDLFFHRDVIDAACRQLRIEIEKSGGLTMSEIRQILGTSRKFAIPLCEYLDSIDFTRRAGDQRILGTHGTA